VDGGFRVFDALNTTFASLTRREAFARRELIEFLLLCREESLNPLTIKGSYAGAMGVPQFMPSSYRHYAIDYDRDGKRDLWESDWDVAASVANYLKRYGWQKRAPIRQFVQANSEHPSLRRLAQHGTKGKTTVKELQKMGVVWTGQTLPLDTDQKVSVIASPSGNPKEVVVLFKNFNTLLKYNRAVNYALAVADLAEELTSE